ncbi:hypothetical protein [Mycolicibacterium sp. CR10]|uniref:hypothetical protein n=1 Tax=Mycolicibacterium sp. CR10 TaxID=2562314 RepID=UPI0010C10634|nr:hypothetical protein [Mycolicibacterium sp. CR10]
MTAAIPTVERRDLPPVPAPGATKFFETDAYAIVTVGKITAEVLRLSYWDPRDGADSVDIEYEVRINGLPDAGGLADISVYASGTLTELAAVCITAEVLLAEVTR